MGKSVLLVDSDPQCNLTSYLLADDVVDESAQQVEQERRRDDLDRCSSRCPQHRAGTANKAAICWPVETARRRHQALGVRGVSVRLLDRQLEAASRRTEGHHIDQHTGRPGRSAVASRLCVLRHRAEHWRLEPRSSTRLQFLHRARCLRSVLHACIGHAGARRCRDGFSTPRPLRLSRRTTPRFFQPSQPCSATFRSDSGSTGRTWRRRASSYLKEIKKRVQEDVAVVLRKQEACLAPQPSLDPMLGQVKDLASLVQVAQRRGRPNLGMFVGHNRRSEEHPYDLSQDGEAHRAGGRG